MSKTNMVCLPSWRGGCWANNEQNRGPARCTPKGGRGSLRGACGQGDRLEKASWKKQIYTEWMDGRVFIGPRRYWAEGRANMILCWEEAQPTRSFEKARATEAGQGRWRGGK